MRGKSSLREAMENRMSNVNVASLKEIVTEDFRAAAIFEKYSLDFCCRGGHTIEQACMEKDVNKSQVLADLDELMRSPETRNGSFNELGVADLVGHIINTHHAYVRKMIPVLLAHTAKVAAVHGPNHPEVVEIAAVFERVAAELQHHMMKEERILFPYIGQLAEASIRREPAQRPPFETARNPIRMMEAEHQIAGDALYEVRRLSSNYTPPADACTTYKVTYQELQEFERDLHQHVHLENNMLFPKAIALEEQVFSSAA